MPLLFSYGTLQEEQVQLSTYGRRLAGQRDAAVGFQPSSVLIPDPDVAARLGRTHHANATLTARPEDHVPGTVFEVSDAELAKTDEFEEPFAYRRLLATLASGRQAWIYVHHP